jgi:ribosomal protein S3
MTIEDKTRYVASSVGFFYYHLDRENLEEATKSLNMLKITKIEYDEEACVAVIHLQRPGIIIGRKGKNIEALLAYVQKQCASYFEVKSIKIVEAPEIYGLWDFAYSQDHMGDDFP